MPAAADILRAEPNGSQTNRPPKARQWHGPAGACCTSETVKAGEVEAVRNVARWLRRPQVRANGWHGGLLEINGTPYGVASCTADGPDGHYLQVVDLVKVQGGDHYRVTLTAGGADCTCPHATYRKCRCKHPACVRAALEWLEQEERLVWERQVAEAAINEYPAEAPF